MPELTIVILTFNSSGFIESCLDFVFGQTYQDFEVILVDNGSIDNTLSLVKGNYPQVRLIENRHNLGAAKARNQAVEVAQGRWVLTLDCDVVLEKDFLNKIMRFAKEAEESIGMFQPKILREAGKVIDSAGIFLSKSRRFHNIGNGQLDTGQFNYQRYIFGPCSAAALYKRQMLEEIKQDTGYFDERFFFLVEDVDLAWRAQAYGWKTIFFPKAVCMHIGNSSGFQSDFRQYLSFRNRYFLILKNDSFSMIIKNALFLIRYDIPRLFYLLFTNKYTLKALYQIIKLTPKMLEKRSVCTGEK